MTLEELDSYLAGTAWATELAATNDASFTIIKGIVAADGKTYDAAFKRLPGTPWTPESAVHVRPHCVPMGEHASQASPLGPEWQYLSRRFDRTPSPKSFVAHILTVLKVPS